MKVTILGSGTSTGVPVVGCACRVCQSENSFDRRLRASILVEDGVRVLVDSGPDFRQQMLANRIDSLDAVLYTHAHYDHLGGLDDLRPYSHAREGLTCYCDGPTRADILHRYAYLEDRENLSHIPRLNLERFPENQDGSFSPFYLGQLKIQPVRLLHVPSKQLYSTGFVFNDTLAYLTDFKEICLEDRKYLYQLPAMIVGSPLPQEHPNHLSFYQAFDLIAHFNPSAGFIGHLGHHWSHQTMEELFPEKIKPLFDQMVLSF